jgi:hypothetical protein
VHVGAEGEIAEGAFGHLPPSLRDDAEEPPVRRETKMDFDMFGRIVGAGHDVVSVLGASDVAASWKQSSGGEHRFESGPTRS